MKLNTDCIGASIVDNLVQFSIILPLSAPAYNHMPELMIIRVADCIRRCIRMLSIFALILVLVPGIWYRNPTVRSWYVSLWNNKKTCFQL